MRFAPELETCLTERANRKIPSSIRQFAMPATGEGWNGLYILFGRRRAFVDGRRSGHSEVEHEVVKVMFHGWEFPPRGSGIGAYVARMAGALRDAGHAVVIATSVGDGLAQHEETSLGTVHRCYTLDEIGSARVRDVVLGLARDHGVDFIEGVDHLGESASLLPVRHRPPVLIKCHYNDVLVFPRYAQARYAWQKLAITAACLRARDRIARERSSIEGAEMLTTPCLRMMDEIRQARLSIPACHAVIPNPVRSLPDWVNCEAADPTMLFVGRLDIGKGIQFLAVMLRELARRFPDARLELAGEDTMARGIGSLKTWLIRQLGALADRVRFLGRLSARELDEAYRRAWVVIVPSRWDTFPSVVQEAMVRAKAIVASPHGGMPEMLHGTECAIADPGAPAFVQAVAGYIADEDRRRQAGARARERAARVYSPVVIADAYIRQVQAWL
jgi:glycosyltransferase involved in cell wall biosynthesis